MRIRCKNGERWITAFYYGLAGTAPRTNEKHCLPRANRLCYVFGSRAKIYPYGGHLGNMTYAANVAYMINVFKN